MRASDRDRAVVHDVLASAYAEGRIDRQELDERTTQVDAAKTYASLVQPLQDLTVDATPARFSPLPSSDLRRSARVYYGSQLRDAFFGFLVPNLICWMIWVLTGHDYFPWPIFVTIPTGLNLLRVAASRGEIIERRIQKLERRQAEALKPPKPAKAKDPERGDSGQILRENQDKPEGA